MYSRDTGRGNSREGGGGRRASNRDEARQLMREAVAKKRELLAVIGAVDVAAPAWSPPPSLPARFSYGSPPSPKRCLKHKILMQPESCVKRKNLSAARQSRRNSRPWRRRSTCCCATGGTRRPSRPGARSRPGPAVSERAGWSE